MSKINVKLFKELIDNTESKILALNEELEKMYDYVGLSHSGNYELREVSRKLLELSRQAISDTTIEDGIVKRDLDELQAVLIYEEVFNKVDNAIYLAISDYLFAYQHPYVSTESENKWKIAIQYLRDYHAIDQLLYASGPITSRLPLSRYYKRATTALSLNQYGVTVEIDNLEITILHTENVIEQIEKIIKEIGGINIIAYLFDNLMSKGYYYKIYRRYLVGNRHNITKPDFIEIPYGFLLNLSAKNLLNDQESIAPEIMEEKIEKVIGLAKDLAIVWDVFPTSVFQDAYIAVEDFPKFISNIAIYDSVYSFPSNSIYEIIEYIENYFSWIDEIYFENSYGFSFNDMLQLISVINEITKENGPVKVYLSQIKRKLPDFPEDKIVIILQHFCHDPSEVNKGYQYFEHFNELNFEFKPLIKLSETMFLMCDKSWCAKGFYESVATMIRAIDRYKDESNSQIGTAMETYLYRKLQESGISLSYGKYLQNKPEAGEADGIIESNNSIVLLEIKKKVLTRESKSGKDTKLVIDLFNSLLDAQSQAVRTEILLRERSVLVLDNNGCVSNIERKNRQFERIALTQWDFGSFQDRTLIFRLLEIFKDAEIELIDESDADLAMRFKSLKKKQRAWNDQIELLNHLDPTFKEFPHFHSWFLSIPQLINMVEHCNNDEEFCEALLKTRHISFGSRNFYLEFYMSHLLGKASK